MRRKTITAAITVVIAGACPCVRAALIPLEAIAPRAGPRV